MSSRGHRERPSYTSYPGTGENANWKPRIMRSVNLADPALWRSTGNNIWKAVPHHRRRYKRQCRHRQYRARQERYDTQDGRIQAVVCRRAACAEATFLQPFSSTWRSTDDLFLLEKNPAEFYSFIEAAPKINNVSVKKPEWYVLDGLAFGYTAAHGVGGAGHSHAWIRNCDSSGSVAPIWRVTIGPHVTATAWSFGAWRLTAWSRVVVLNLRLSRDQPRQQYRVGDVLWRNNTVYLCEQAYEIWFSNPESEVDGVTYEGNSSYDCGFGRVMYNVPTKTEPTCWRIVWNRKSLSHYHDNRFYNTTERMIWFYNPSQMKSHVTAISSGKRAPIPTSSRCSPGPDRTPRVSDSTPIGLRPATIPNRVSKKSNAYPILITDTTVLTYRRKIELNGPSHT